MFPFFFRKTVWPLRKTDIKKLSKSTFGYFDKIHCTCTPANKTKQKKKTKQNKKENKKQKTKKSKLTKQTSTKLNK